MKKSVSKSFMVGIIVLTGTIALTGCLPGPSIYSIPKPEPYQIKASFNIEQAEHIMRPGTGTIKGSGLIRQAGGGIVTCAGNDVWLLPVTDYSTERITVIYGNATKGYKPYPTGSNFASTDSDFARLHKTAQCDAQGFFKFEDVSDGEFFVSTLLIWKIPVYSKTLNRSYSKTAGGGLMQRVSVQPDEVKEIVLTP